MSLLSLVVFIVGLAGVLMLLGLVGRSVKTPPHCRQCRYNLVGSPEAIECPECGAGLITPDAITHHRRQRRPRITIAGAVLLLLAVLPLAPRLAGINPYQYAPASWLMRIASKGNTPTAIDELLDRLKNGNLTGEQVILLIEAALVAQANINQQWDADWGNIIETADANGQVTPPHMARYAQVAAESGVSFNVRPRVRKGDPIPYGFRRSGGRTGDKGLWVRRVGKNLRIGGVDKRMAGSSGGQRRAGSNGGGFSSSAQWGEGLDGIALGRVEVTATVRYEVYRDHVFSRKSPPPVLYEGDRTFTATTTFVHADDPTVRFITDPSVRDAMAAAFSVKSHQLTYNTSNGSLDLTIKAIAAPYASAFEVRLQRGDKRWKAGNVNFPAGGHNGHGVGAWLKDFDADVVDIVLEPSLEAAAETIDRTAIWGERIVIKDVPVLRR